MPPRKRTSARTPPSPPRRRQRRAPPGRRRAATLTPSAYGAPELIVIADPAAALRIGTRGVESGGGADTRALNRVAVARRRDPATAVRSRGAHPARGSAARSVGHRPGPRPLGLLPRRRAGRTTSRASPRSWPAARVSQAAYVKPAERTARPQRHGSRPPRTRRRPRRTSIANQLYLDPAPGGVDARYAWTWPGGGGAGVSIIDCEWGWRFDHEDLTADQGGVVVGTGEHRHQPRHRRHRRDQRRPERVRHHRHLPRRHHQRRRVLGPDGADDPSGRRPARRRRHHPARDPPRRAAAQLPGRDDQLGYIAIEWWPDDFDAIRYATQRGIIVVEAAGQRRENLDDALYSVRPAGFPARWTNPFNRANRDSERVVVGAGAPPPGNPRRQLRGRPLAAGLLQLRRPDRRAGLGPRGHVDRATATCRAGRTHGFWYTETVLRHLQRVADRRRRPRLAPGRAACRREARR